MWELEEFASILIFHMEKLSHGKSKWPTKITQGEDQELSMFALTRSPTLTISGPTPISLYGHPGWNDSGFPWTSVQKVLVNVQIKINRVDSE